MLPARCDGKTCGTGYRNYGKLTLCEHNNLQILFPEICEQWNYELNNKTPRNYFASSKILVWWKCKNIECKCKTWQSTIHSRTHYKTECHCCEGRFCVHNNLETTHPQLCQEWDYNKNDKPPSQYTHGSGDIVFWKCIKNNCGCHSYEMKILNRTYNESGCPFCSNNRVCKHYNAEVYNPKLANEWDYTKNINPPSYYAPFSMVEVYLICTKDKSHKWKASIYNRNRGCFGCPDCKIIERINYNLLTEYPVVCEEWDYEVNNLTPNNYFPHTDKKVWWSCKNNSLHKWKTSISSRTNNDPTGCPFCSLSRPSIEYNLEICNGYLASLWDYDKNDTLPSDYTPYSSKKVWWKCSKNSTHFWEATINGNNNKSYGHYCPYCNLSKPSEEYNLSIDNEELISEWDYDKNDDIPSNYTPFSTKKVWWKCKKNHQHSWEAAISCRNSGTGCPKCFNHGYSKIQIEWLNLLSTRENIYIIHAENNSEYYIPDVGKVDGYCKENNTVYEFHGDFYHGNPIKFNSEDINTLRSKTYGELYEKTMRRDELIISKGYNLVTIWEYDFLKLRKEIKKETLISNKTKLMTNKDIKCINADIKIAPNRIKLQIINESKIIDVKPVKKLKLIIIDTK